MSYKETENLYGKPDWQTHKNHNMKGSYGCFYLYNDEIRAPELLLFMQNSDIKEMMVTFNWLLPLNN